MKIFIRLIITLVVVLFIAGAALHLNDVYATESITPIVDSWGTVEDLAVDDRIDYAAMTQLLTRGN